MIYNVSLDMSEPNYASFYGIKVFMKERGDVIGRSGLRTTSKALGTPRRT